MASCNRWSLQPQNIGTDFDEGDRRSAHHLMEFFLFIFAVIVLASLQYQVDLKYLNNDYERWKRNRK